MQMQKEQQAEELKEMLNMIGSDHDEVDEGEGPQTVVKDEVDDMLEGRVVERKKIKKKKKVVPKSPISDKGEKTF